MKIEDLYASAWDNAIDQTAEYVNKLGFDYTYGDWRVLEPFAIVNDLEFDENGFLVDNTVEGCEDINAGKQFTFIGPDGAQYLGEILPEPELPYIREWGESMYGGYYFNYIDENGRPNGEHAESLEELEARAAEMGMSLDTGDNFDNTEGPFGWTVDDVEGCDNVTASADVGEAAQYQRLKRKEAAKQKGNKELLDQYALLVGTQSRDSQAIEVIYDEILSRMNKSQVKASKKISRKEVYEYLDELGGYVGYDDKIDALVEDLGISREDAEGYVWNHASGLDHLNGQR